MQNSLQSIPQFDIIHTGLSGHTIIEASAGTGKTYTISRLFIRFLLEYEYKPSSILIVTFTDAATQELRERIHSLLRETIDAFTSGVSTDPFLVAFINRLDPKKSLEILQNALHSFDTIAIHTIHGFCQRILFEYTFESGMTFGATIITDQTDLLREVTNDFWRRNFYHESDLFISYAIENGLSPQKLRDLISTIGKNALNLRIIPEITEFNTTNEEAIFLDHYKQITDSWENNRGEIIQLLNSGNLRGIKYSAKIISEMIQSFDAMCKSPVKSTSLFPKFVNFTQTCITGNTKKNCQVPLHPFFSQCETFLQISENLQKLFERKSVAIKHRFCNLAIQELTGKKKIKGLLYFDDLLLNVYNALKSDNAPLLIESLRKSYKVALIDEFQDTDPIQYEIFSSIFAKPAPMFLIGDPKQSIYSFRGADIFTYLKAFSKVDHRYTLSKNYRSDPGFLSALNTVFHCNKNPFIYDQIMFTDAIAGKDENSEKLYVNGVLQPNLNFLFIDQNAPEFKGSDKTSAISKYIASKIYHLLTENTCINSKKLSPSDIAVLVRTNNEAAAIQNALREHTIPSLIDSGGSVFETLEAIELEMLLRALLEPNRTDRIKAVLSSSLFGYNCIEIDNLTHDQRTFETLIHRFILYHDLWHEHGFAFMFRSFLSREKIRQRILSFHSGERKLTNILHLAELLHIQEQYTSGMIGLHSWLVEKLTDSSTHVPDEEILRLESDRHAVQIVTIHKSKGLEYPVVFCPFLWHNSEISPARKNDPYLFHDPNNQNHPTMPIGPDEIETYRGLAEKEILAENMRLLYVALTRAKSACYTVWGKLNSSESSALSYLLHGQDITDPFVSSIKARISTLPDDAIINTLSSLSNLNPNIGLETSVNFEQGLFTEQNADPESLSFTQFQSEIPEQWRISSFTSLTKKAAAGEMPDYDSELYETVQLPIDETSEEKNIFTFPSGSVAGTFLHEILEKTDFEKYDKSSHNQFICERLHYYGFEEHWSGVIGDLLHTIFNTPLDQSNKLKLADINRQHCLKEVEFYFPLNEINPSKISTVLTNSSQTDLFSSEYCGDGLNFSPTHGFIKGFIDLVFFWKDKFYLLDWKSNNLGSSHDAYRESNLTEEMKKSHYNLQYLLYTVALNRYLSLRYPGYKYNKHFGGVFYLFLRGMQTDSKTGIYYDLPRAEAIMELDKILISGPV